MNTLIAGPIDTGLSGEISPPGDKSMSHRAVMLASMATGTTHIEGFLAGDDNLATAAMFADMGVRIEWLNDEKTALRVHGVGLHGLQEPQTVLDAGNSGTCARLMLGVLAAQPFYSVMRGDASLHQRPMRRVVEPMLRMGANIDGREAGDKLPLSIRGTGLHAIDHVSKVASAQVKSCVMMAALFADGETTVREPRPTRDHTERMLPLFAQPVRVDDDGLIRLRPCGSLQAVEGILRIPADPSSAAFFAVAAALLPQSSLCLRQIGLNPRRDGWRRIFQAMGANIDLQEQRMVGAEPVADLHVQTSALHGVQVSAADVPDAIDEFPVLFAAACLADGEFVLQGAEELRVKESDRISVMAAALRACGACLQETSDGIRIQGGRLQGGVCVDAHGDHRIAMAMAVAAQRMQKPIEIINAAAICTSFPDFVPIAQSLGMNVAWQVSS